MKRFMITAALMLLMPIFVLSQETWRDTLFVHNAVLSGLSDGTGADTFLVIGADGVVYYSTSTGDAAPDTFFVVYSCNTSGGWIFSGDTIYIDTCAVDQSLLKMYWSKSGTNLYPMFSGDDILLPNQDKIQFKDDKTYIHEDGSGTRGLVLRGQGGVTMGNISNEITLKAGAWRPVTDNGVALGTSTIEFSDGFFDGTVYTDDFEMQDGSQGAGKVLTSDANGNASWTAACTFEVTVYDKFDGHPCYDCEYVVQLDGEIGQVRDTVTLSVVGGTAPYTYLWSNSSTNDSINFLLCTTNDTSFSVTVTDAKGCKGYGSVQLIRPLVTADAGIDQTILEGTYTQLHGFGDTYSGLIEYVWTPASSFIDTDIPDPVTNEIASTTVFTLTVNDIKYGCSKVATMTVTVASSGNTYNFYTDVTAGDKLNYVTINDEGLTLTGTATVFDDLRVDVNAVRLSSTKPPSWTTFKGSEVLGFSNQPVEGNEELVYFTAQFPHARKDGSNIEAHVHWTTSATSATDSVKWELSYSWASIGDTFPTETLITGSGLVGTVASKHMMTSIGVISGTGKTISSMLVCRLRRKSSNASDTFTGSALLLEIDFHYEIDALGSRDYTTK